MEKEKLTEKINALKVSKSVKKAIIKIADEEQIQIQQACRRLLTIAINDYFNLKQANLKERDNKF